MKKTLRIIALVTGMLILLLLSGITIPLGFLNPQIESIASQLLGRKVTLEAPARLTTSLHPEIVLGEFTISNPLDWPEESHLLVIQHARGKISALPLLSGEILIDELVFEGVEVNLLTRPDLSNNYQFSLSSEDTEHQSSHFELSGVSDVQLRDVKISYDDAAKSEKVLLTIEEALGKGLPGKPLSISARGIVQAKPYSLELSGDPLSDLIQGSDQWFLSGGQLNIANTKLDISGALDNSITPATGQFSVYFAGNDLSEMGELLDLSLPESAEFSVQSRIDIQADIIRFSELELSALNSTALGDFAYAFGDQRPALQGALSISKLDTALLASIQSSDQEKAIEEAPEATPITEDALTPSWDMLKMLDTDLHLKIDHLELDELQIQDLDLAISLKNGDLDLPLSFIIEDAPVAIELELETSKPVPEMALSFSSKSLEIGHLLKTTTGEDRFSGQSGTVALKVKSRGSSLLEVLNGMDLNLQLTGNTLNTEAGQMFSAKDLSLVFGPDHPFSLSGQGVFLERPYRVNVREEMPITPQAATSYTFDIYACDTSLKLETTSYSQRNDQLIDYNYSLGGKDICGMLGSLEGFIQSEIDFYSTGAGKLRDNHGTLDLGTLRLGTLEMDVRAELTIKEDGKPQLSADIHGSKLDLSPFLPGRPGAPGTLPTSPAEQAPTEEKPSAQKQNAAVLEDVLKQEILPQIDLLLPDAAINFHIEELDTGFGGASNIRLAANIKDGALTDAPFRVTIAEELFTGNARMNLTGESPVVHFELSTNDFHLPILLEEFHIENAPDLMADHIELLLEFRGHNLMDMLQQTSQMLAINGGKWRLDREFGETLFIDIEQAKYQSRPDTPATIDLKGHINSEALSIHLTEDGLFGQGAKPINLTVNASLADTELHIDGKVLRHKNSTGEMSNLHTVLSGGRMSHLNDLLGLDLPPLGPYTIDGSMKSNEEGIDFHDMLLQIGDSTLKGDIRIDVTTNEQGSIDFPVVISTIFEAESIQLNDFQFEGWSALLGDRNMAETPEEKSPEQAPKSKGQLENLISPEVAEKARASLNIKVREVLSGTDQLGSGTLNASLENGVYSLHSLHLDIPGGAVDIDGSLKPEKDRILSQLNMQIKHLDYGVLARRVQPGSDLKGEVNLKLKLKAEADDPTMIKQHLNGHFQFGVAPEEYKAGVLDLWAVNILTAALPVLLKGSKSEVNCLAGDFTFIDGIMIPNVFLLDTSRIRVEGKGKVNLKTDEIDFHLLPTPKSAHLFSAATPVSISGSITDPDIGVSAGDVVATVFHMAAGLITTPFKKIFMQSIEPDGKTACGAAMQWVHEPREENQRVRLD